MNSDVGGEGEIAGGSDVQSVLSRLDRIEKLLKSKAEDPPDDEATDARTPAGHKRGPAEHRAAATIAVLVAILLVTALPPRVASQPRWLFPSVAFLLLLGLVIARPGRLEHESKALRIGSIGLIAVLSIANASSALRLVVDLVRGQGIDEPSDLLLTAAAIWATNVIVFALWYWESDRGGPVRRALKRPAHPDFLFPQMTTPPELVTTDWAPMFVDYLYLSYTNATAFSPTDVMPMTRWAKMVMLLQSAVSILTVALVVARAVNILQ